MSSRNYDVVIVGAGHSGLCLAALLHRKAPQLRVCVVESGARVASAWSTRWPGLTLFSPASFSNLLPDFTWQHFAQANPSRDLPTGDALPTAEQVAEYLDAFKTALIGEHVEFRFNCRVDRLSRADPPPRPVRSAPRATEVKEALEHNASVPGDASNEPSSAFSTVAVAVAAPAPTPVVPLLAGAALHRTFELVCVEGDAQPLVLRARQVALCTGSFRVPRLPRRLCDALHAAAIPWLHSSDFRGWDVSLAPLLAARQSAAPAHVVIVGAGASGTQIALDVARRRLPVRVFLVGRDPGSLPRRMFGRDIYAWLWKTGALTMDRESFVGKRAMLASQGHGDMLIGSLQADATKAGVQRLAARVVGFHPQRNALRLVSPADQLLGDATRDAVVQRALENTVEDGGVIRVDPDQKLLGNGGWLCADVVVFATGFADSPAARYPFVSGMFEDDDPSGEAWHTHTRGSCQNVPGLYVLGEPWQQRADSSLLHGCAVDATHLVHCIKALQRDIGGGRTGSCRELTKLTSASFEDSEDEET